MYEEGDELNDQQLKKLMDALEAECQRCDEREDELERIICDTSQGDFARTVAMSKLIHNDAEWHGYLWCLSFIKGLL